MAALSVQSSLFLLWTAYALGSKIFRRWAIAHYTVLSELPELGTPRKDVKKLYGTAIICGGSIAGLLTARVCVDHFARVVVIDPEAEALVTAALDPGAVLDPPPHARVMQYKAAHGTQAIYHYAMSKLFPGRYESELDAAGAHVGPGAYNIHLGGQFISAALDQLPEPGRMMVGASRACQETILRRLVAEDKRIEFVTGTVVAFTADPTGPRKLTGVSYRPASDSTSSVEMKGDLIIDCTGFAHCGLALLQRIPGLVLPPTIVDSYHPHVSYAIGKFQHAAAAFAPYFQQPHACETSSPWLSAFAPLSEMENRWLILGRIERDQLYIALGGVGFTGHAESVAELRAHAASLRGVKPLPSWLFSVLDNLEAQEAEHPTEYSHLSISAMHWVKYHEHTSVLPSNFIAAGDSWLRLDPLLGQGMSKAMAEAITLDAVLRRVRPSLSTVPAIAPAYFKKISARMAGVWMGGKLGDYEFEACEPVAGESRDIEPVMRAVRMAAVKRMLRGDQDLQRRMSGVNAWVLPPTDLLAPSVLVRLAMDWALGR